MSTPGDKQKHLLVPINVEALLVGGQVAKPGQGWSDLSPDFSRLWEGNILGGQLTPSLESDQKPLHLPGVHLHWALPDALTHGRQTRGEDGAEPNAPPEFPYIPNRWMVQRLIHSEQGTEVRVRAWVIESDYLFGEDETPQAQCVTLPKLDAPPLYAHAGRQFDYDDWQEGADTAYRIELRALGYGDPAFAAYYPACKSLLGFHDELKDVDGSLKDVDGSRLSYLVTGWYSDPARDPLHPGNGSYTPTQWLARLDQLKWATEPPYPLARVEVRDKRILISGHGDLSGQFPPGEQCQVLDDDGRASTYTVAGSAYEAPEFRLRVAEDPAAAAGGRVLPPRMDCPERILCHGFICNIGWRGKEAVYGSRVPELNEQNCRVAVGMSSAEALSALLAEGLLDDARAQALLTAFQSDMLAHETDNRELQSLLHQNRFNALDGGRRVEIRKETSDDLQTTAGEDAALSAEVSGLLDALNRELDGQERRRRALVDYRWELFAAWYQQTRLKLDDLEDRRIQSLNERIESLKRRIEQEEQALSDEATRSGSGHRDLESALGEKFTAMQTLESPAPPFWRARDPAVLVAAEATRLSRRHGHDGRYSDKDRLQCRISGQESTAIRVDLPNNRRGVKVAASAAFKVRRDDAGGGPVPPETTGALLQECLLLDPIGGQQIAEQAYVGEGLSSRPGVDEVLAAIRLLQTLSESPGGARSTGTLPSPIAKQVWQSNPWLPLFLKWRLVWHSSFDALPDALAGWSFTGEGEDYCYKGATLGSEYPSLYQGYNILTPHALDRFRDALAGYNEEAGDQDLEKMLTRLGGLNILSQVLGGLGEAFRMRDTVLQLPPINYPLPPDTKPLLDPIAELVRDAADASPDPDKPFFPIRAGHAKLIELAIVDAFGQTLQVPKGCLQRPLRAGGMEGAEETYIRFSPRLAQPMRLRFDWTPADNSPGFPLNSPVCGWVLPNYLDKSLLIYDAAGNALGALQKILRLSAAAATGGAASDDLPAFFWVPRPGTELQPEAIHNPQLRGFVRFLLAMGADTGDAFWQRFDGTLGKMDSGVPEEDPLTSVLVGRPLALVRLALNLELAGLPASDQSTEWAGQLASGGFERVKFPLLFGDAKRDNDGLVSYFRDSEGAADALGPLYPAAGAMPDSLADDSPLAIDCSDPVPLTLLMDPLARVHARTGLLPRTYCELPHRWRSAARTVKTAFFQVAPIISPGGDLRLPKPSDDFGKWSWACRPRVTVWKEYATIDPLGDRAGFPPVRQELQEGWLKLRLNPVAILKFAVREGGPLVQAGANITLQWLLKGGTRLQLFGGPDETSAELLGDWTAPFPEQFRLRVDADTSYRLRLSDADGNRDEKQLTIKVDKVNS